ncbi:MAG: FdtA/QdtA family cupin domain-containing protein [Flavobacteriaceae bacterium]|jgi:hypothetical protein|nr:FdtA/QdtA family cupin domain-containing protein [Flavobacteriaceae bacterium]
MKNIKISRNENILIPKKYVLDKINTSDEGIISVLEKENLPFVPKRTYWIYDVPTKTKRGGHYHYQLEQVIIAISGVLKITLEDTSGVKYKFTLEKPNEYLHIPKGYWRDIFFEKNTILYCIASEEYDENDYVRDYDKFCNLVKN